MCKMSFTGLPSIMDRSEKSAEVLSEKDEAGRVRVLIIHSSSLCVLPKETRKSQNQRPVTMTDKTCHGSRRRNKGLMANADCNHSCEEN